MMIKLLIFLIISHFVLVSRKITLVYSKVIFPVLISYFLLCINSFDLNLHDKGLELFGGLYFITSVNHQLLMFIFISFGLLLPSLKLRNYNNYIIIKMFSIINQISIFSLFLYNKIKNAKNEYTIKNVKTSVIIHLNSVIYKKTIDYFTNLLVKYLVKFISNFVPYKLHLVYGIVNYMVHIISKKFVSNTSSLVNTFIIYWVNNIINYFAILNNNFSFNVHLILPITKSYVYPFSYRDPNNKQRYGLKSVLYAYLLWHGKLAKIVPIELAKYTLIVLASIIIDCFNFDSGLYLSELSLDQVLTLVQSIGPLTLSFILCSNLICMRQISLIVNISSRYNGKTLTFIYIIVTLLSLINLFVLFLCVYFLLYFLFKFCHRSWVWFKLLINGLSGTNESSGSGANGFQNTNNPNPNPQQPGPGPETGFSSHRQQERDEEPVTGFNPQQSGSVPQPQRDPYVMRGPFEDVLSKPGEGNMERTISKEDKELSLQNFLDYKISQDPRAQEWKRIRAQWARDAYDEEYKRLGAETRRIERNYYDSVVRTFQGWGAYAVYQGNFITSDSKLRAKRELIQELVRFQYKSITKLSGFEYLLLVDLMRQHSDAQFRTEFNTYLTRPCNVVLTHAFIWKVERAFALDR